MERTLFAALVWSALSTQLVQAEALSDAANAMCEKVKQCTIAHMGEADMTPEMRQMIEPMVNSMCDAMRAGIKEVPTNHELYQPAVACMRSMAELSCSDFQDEQKVHTDACEAYRQQADQVMAES
ncbi:hypothetical protein BST95_08060 [Halioglobus japonicus]|uniref:Uncharacterized protein n=1 Tax=Halioglobus japonicus TaxID=930805 RepID=A0AAP8MEI7_9GAMM|nr:hypothetical protein [Halioglobus japonicus]AQA18195.1 hypothetical protein BST95_08060 [Halioglobus japonicus]PLW86199.1 hypothetical protein C0029_07110 [Halioglobus japonicus]GHD13970.1 hypothetical protein GCM10007052_17060 [Halioglobus japonicus]